MLEDFLFGNLIMGGETIRIALALLGVFVGAYFDIFNKRNIPNNFLFTFLGIAAITNLVFLDMNLLTYALGVVGALGLIGYLFYVLGYLGGADVFILVSLALLLPISPSMSEVSINYPFVLFVLIFSFVSSSLYLFCHFALKLTKEKNVMPDKKYFLLLIPYGVIAYLVWNLPFMSPAFMFILYTTLLLSIFFMAYRPVINKMMTQKIPLKKVEEEDVLALEFMDKDLVWKHRLQRLVTEDELKRLKMLKIKELMVYTKLPPFLPFIFVGLMLALLFSKYLLLV